MKDSIERDRKLLESLDRILEGSESEIAGTIDDDTRTALDIARRMATLRETPSKEFTKNLKAQLVHQLAEQEKNDLSVNHTLLFWGITRRRLWQGTLAAAILVIILAVILLVVLLINEPG